MTLEEAQAKILELNETLAQVTNERDTHLTELTAVKEENESLRKLNQNYFNKLSAQIVDTKEDNEPEDVPTCEEFAKTLKI